MSMGDFPEILSQSMLVGIMLIGIMLIGQLGVTSHVWRALRMACVVRVVCSLLAA